MATRRHHSSGQARPAVEPQSVEDEGHGSALKHAALEHAVRSCGPYQAPEVPRIFVTSQANRSRSPFGADCDRHVADCIGLRLRCVFRFPRTTIQAPPTAGTSMATVARVLFPFTQPGRATILCSV